MLRGRIVFFVALLTLVALAASPSALAFKWVKVGNFDSLISDLESDYLPEFIERALRGELETWFDRIRRDPGLFFRDISRARHLFQAVTSGGAPLRDLIVGSVMSDLYETFTGLSADVWSRPGFREAECLSREVLGVDPRRELERLAADRMLRNMSVMLGGGGGGGFDLARILNCFSLGYREGATLASSLEASADRDRPRGAEEVRKEARTSSTVISAGRDMEDEAQFNAAVKALQSSNGTATSSDGTPVSRRAYELITARAKIDYATARALEANAVGLAGDEERRKLAEEIARMMENVSGLINNLGYTSDDAIKDLLKVALLQARIQLLILDQLQAMNRLLAAKVSYDIDYRARKELRREVLKTLAGPATGAPGGAGLPAPAPATPYEFELEQKKEKPLPEIFYSGPQAENGTAAGEGGNRP